MRSSYGGEAEVISGHLTRLHSVESLKFTASEMEQGMVNSVKLRKDSGTTYSWAGHYTDLFFYC
jgi:hypothetical protein